ncbi:Hypothetical protein, putative [Bodo saltans]|uniref:Uncharacterized protein n=1 Tax=Bodo saltans TaxID=75058 RepID=A0A0S4JGQ6_BODSA|nr:Hypothetical protein, putative [Bodo saltans]|eukprot:CUG88409.1 Hypothetical protein, putative [Bodo saltans]
MRSFSKVTSRARRPSLLLPQQRHRHVAAGSSSGAMRATRMLLVGKGASDSFEFMWAQEDKVDMSLYEDPSGGLSVSEATELGEKELRTEMAASLNAFDPVAYYVAFLPIVDTVSVLKDCGSNVVPAIRPEVFISNCFHDPRSSLSNSNHLETAMGGDAFAAFSVSYLSWVSEMEQTMPLNRVLTRYNIPPTSGVQYSTFLRVVGCGLWSRNWDMKQTRLQQLPSIALSLCNGRAEAWAPTGFGNDEEKRLHFVAELLVALGQEIGNSSPAFLGIQLLRANNVEVPYRTQKALTNVFASIQRTKTDWELRGSGQLRDVVPKWLSKYFKKVEGDALAAHASRSLQPSSEKCFDDRGDHKLDGLCGYFQRVANADIAAMQRNIAASVSSRQDAAKKAISAEEISV